jgi:hypothetical protein
VHLDQVKVELCIGCKLVLQGNCHSPSWGWGETAPAPAAALAGNRAAAVAAAARAMEERPYSDNTGR